MKGHYGIQYKGMAPLRSKNFCTHLRGNYLSHICVPKRQHPSLLLPSSSETGKRTGCSWQWRCLLSLPERTILGKDFLFLFPLVGKCEGKKKKTHEVLPGCIYFCGCTLISMHLLSFFVLGICVEVIHYFQCSLGTTHQAIRHMCAEIKAGFINKAHFLAVRDLAAFKCHRAAWIDTNLPPAHDSSLREYSISR